MKKNIDILLSVIDNYGDMGFACELLIWLERVYPWVFVYDIWTDDVWAVTSFFERNRGSLSEYRVNMMEKFCEEIQSSFCISLFHGFIPDIRFFQNPSMILRVDYLSLDPLWVGHHEKEHIGSTEGRKIIEIIPSPLPEGGGIFPCLLWKHTRQDIADMFSLDISKEWISIFVYPETLSSCIDFSDIPPDREILLLWSTRGMHPEAKDKHIHFFPFLTLELFHHVLAHSLWSIIRGELSWMNMVALEKPFFWDMYKSLGGFPEEQSRQFLELFEVSSNYRGIHNHINTGFPWKFSLHECEYLLMSWKWNMSLKKKKPKDLIHEVKKFIDSFYFSL